MFATAVIIGHKHHTMIGTSTSDGTVHDAISVPLSSSSIASKTPPLIAAIFEYEYAGTPFK